MKKYFVKTPLFIKALFSGLTWEVKTKKNNLFLTFDDGPHPTATPFVLEQLKKHGAKGTFFCIGKNVAEHPNIYQQILDGGHSVGNHTHNHLNGWETATKDYIEDIKRATQFIDSNLFRPPYGKITSQQTKMLKNGSLGRKYEIIMWDVLSADFDQSISPEKCLENVLKNVQQSSIVIFHDSTKAWENMYYTLPKVLEHFSEKGYAFEAI